MEYKKDTRTKNLTLRDIHVGDWVQVWSEQTERYSPPLKIIQICDDGTIYLVTSDEERPTPWEENIKNVNALPITPERLKGFGFEFEKRDYFTDRLDVLYDNKTVGELLDCDDGYEIDGYSDYYKYFHELIDALWKYSSELLNLEWKGV